MNDSNHTQTSAELARIEARLRAERAAASPLELDRIKLQVIRQVERPRPSVPVSKKGAVMKSRLALTLLLAAGFMLSTTGATLAVSGTSGNGSAATSQYVAPTNQGGTPQATVEEGVTGEVGIKGTKREKGAQGVQPEDNTLQPEAAVESAPAPAAAQQAVVSTGSSLPFTGFVAIPLLAIGVGMLLLGVVLALRARRQPLTRH